MTSQPTFPSICDLQEKFRPAIHAYPLILATTRKLLAFAQILQLPVIVTTQDRTKLGQTCGELELDGALKPLVVADADKTRFSMRVPEVVDALQDLQAGNAARDVVIVGIEAHVCVLQTTLDFLAHGHRIYVVADAVSSCNTSERWIALERMRQEGARITSSESLMFELMGDAGTGGFKSMAALIKRWKAETKKAGELLSRL